MTASVLFFCSLAGFAFAKLRFRGRNVLMVIVVILTLTVPNQLGVVALYILMGKLGWNGTLLAGHRAGPGHRVRRVLHAAVHPRTRCRTSWSRRRGSTAR